MDLVIPRRHGRASSRAHAPTARSLAAAALAFSRRPLIRDVVVPFLATRAALLGIGYMAFRLPVDHSVDNSPNQLLSALSRWDGVWYLNIAAQGYGYTQGDFTAIAFAPLFPALMQLFAPIFGGGTDGLLIAGAVIANVALLAACVLLVRLVRLDFDPATARRTPLYVLVFPTSFFLSAVYPESLFLALGVASFYAARRERWLLAAGIAALCVLTRPHGVVIVAALALEYMHQRGFSLRLVRADALALALPMASFGGWLLYQQLTFGDPLAFVHAQAAWMRQPGPPWEAFTNFFTRQQGPWTDVLFALGLLAMTVFAALRLRPSYALFAALLILVPLSTGQLYSMMRFGVSMFPVFMGLALIGRHPSFDRAYVAIGLLVGGAFMTFFASGLLFLA